MTLFPNLTRMAAWIEQPAPPPPPPRLTSQDLAHVLIVAEMRWFQTALRRRLPDALRERWKVRFVARAIALSAFWSSREVARLRAIEDAATTYMRAKLDPRAETNGPRTELVKLLDPARILPRKGGA